MNVKLSKSNWEIFEDRPLGPPGGFGAVFAGSSPEGAAVAIKRLHISAVEAAHRELKMGNDLSDRNHEHIVPVLDCGQDAESDLYYIVMPVCETSLQSYRSMHVLQDVECVSILAQIAAGLEEIPHIVHRDLKPANVLLHEEKWKIADFGIAKFVEDSTSQKTLRDALSPYYAPPEQWEGERAERSADIYALGCIAHFLADGLPPFAGDLDELRSQHIKSVPKAATLYPPVIQSLISAMLRKPPSTRPTAQRCKTVLSREDIFQPEGQMKVQLQSAIATVSQIQSEDAARQIAEERFRAERKAIFDSGITDLTGIKKRLFDAIYTEAHEVMQPPDPGAKSIRLHHASLKIDTTTGLGGVNPSDYNERLQRGWGNRKPLSSWDIVAYGSIELEQRLGFDTKKRAANLILARPSNLLPYRWYECAFYLQFGHGMQVLALSQPWEIDEALSNVMTSWTSAYSPRPIDDEDEPSFQKYWIDLFALAATGALPNISTLPMER